MPKKRGRGRPATGRDPVVSLRMPPALRSEVESWAKTQTDKLTLAKAICRLIEAGLAVQPKRGRAK
jgi:hypothetical protein